MKTVTAPYLPELDGMVNATDISTLLDSCGDRQHINEHPWHEFPYVPLTTFSIGHSDTALYIEFFVRCNYLRAVNYTNQSPVSQDSCVEFFVIPDIVNAPARYFNFEFNCIGAVNASHRERRDNTTRLTDAEIDMIKRYPSCGTRPFCEMEGMFAWSLLVCIPFELMGVRYTPGKPLEMRANFYKCASATSAPHYLTWARVESEKPNFHCPADFGRLIIQ